MSMIESFSLPDDLLIEILQCLPVKTLLRFKSVCKSWFLLIESSEFIDSHTVSSLSSNGTNIFQRWDVKENSWNIFLISSGDGDGDVDHKEFEVVKKDLDDLPPCHLSEQNKLIHMNGSCNGLICLYNYELRDLFLWNPAIHQFRVLPRSSFTLAVIKEDCARQDLVAFGFDVETKDYKVVLVTYQPIGHVQVYSLSTDSWKTLEDVLLPTYPRDINNGGYLNGSYYCAGTKWIHKSTSGCFDRNSNGMPVTEVLSFDFTKEIFKTMPLPDEISEGRRIIDSRHNGIILLGEKIAVSFRFMRDNIFELWVLNEVGVKESWTKLYRIGPYEESYNRYRPIGISNNGEFIFVVSSNGEKLWLLNPSTQVMKEIQYGNSFNQIIRAHVYRSSLVPIFSARNGFTSELSLKFDTSSSDNAERTCSFDRHD